jgi:urease accessory protein
MAQLRLLQLSSPALPIGAFAYSQGLEQAVERNWVTDTNTLHEWLSGLLRRTLAHTDLPLLARAIDAWRSPTPEAGIRALAARVLALRETKELRAEERQLGSSLARVLERLGFAEATPFVGAPDASYVALTALGAAKWEIPERDALGGFAFAWVENQLAAATRVMALGQLDAQQTLSSLMQRIPSAVETALSLPDDQIGNSCPAFALASAWHEQQYSRLFRS